MNSPLSAARTRDFTERYHHQRLSLQRELPPESEPASVLLPRLMLQARHQGHPAALAQWLAEYSDPELSAALEMVLDASVPRRQLGVYSTGADLARHLARTTILPFLLSDLALPADELSALISANGDLLSISQTWLRSAPQHQAEAFGQRLKTITILDPTCGSGPFLLAALRLLAELHEAWSNRLGLPCDGRAIRQHIVERNLFGIDLLPEAVELCRLRLQLEVGPGSASRDNLSLKNVLLGPPPGPGDQRFDVILGNPPYLETREVDYQPQGFRCEPSRAIHALCIERGLDLLAPGGWISMLVPMSLVSTQRMRCVQQLLEEGRNVWYANFSWRPVTLFPGVNRAITLFLATGSARPRTFSTGYLKWRKRDRPRLLGRLRHVEVPRDRPSFWVPKFSRELERPLLDKLLANPTRVEDFLTSRDNPEGRIYYRTDGGLYWKVFTDFAPAFSRNGRAGPSSRQTWLTVQDPAHVVPLIAVLSSDLYWWWYTVTSNCRHLNPIDLHRFPVPESVLADPELAELGREYLAAIVRHSQSRIRQQRQTGQTRTQTFRIRAARPILLRIGLALGRHYGLSEAEMEFLAEYDSEFRLRQ